MIDIYNIIVIFLLIYIAVIVSLLLYDKLEIKYFKQNSINDENNNTKTTKESTPSEYYDEDGKVNNFYD